MMKPALVALICTLVVGHTLGYYVPTNVNDYYTGSCGCSSAKRSDYEYSPPAAEESEDVKYKFDFDVEQPKVAEDSETELKSYGYAIQTPASEPKPDDTKYKFDYALQRPAEERSDEPEQRTMFTKVDRSTYDKTECACNQGKPCSCGYSPEQCAIHCNSQRNPSPYTSGYVLPVRYNNGGDYVVYELPQDASQQLNRKARQAGPQLPAIPSLPPASDAIQSLINGDSFKAVADRIRERARKLSGGDQGEATLGSALDVSALRNRFSSIAEPFVSHATKIYENFTQNFGLPAVSTRRRRREAPETSEEQRRKMMDPKRFPILRVEYEANSDKNEDISKHHTTTSRVELKASDQQESWNGKKVEKATLCHECGSQLSDHNSVCARCGSRPPQYVEYSTGRPVAYYPGANREPNTDSRPAPRYIYDRYGHKYLENNGNLRLIVPQQHQEAMVGEQPNFAGLADILRNHHEIIQQLNPVPGRLMPEPIDIASDAISLVQDLARREIKHTDENKEKRSTPEYKQTSAAAEESKRHFPRSMYQVVPHMRYEGKDGKLVVKVYSSKNDKTNPETNPRKYSPGQSKSATTDAATATAAEQRFDNMTEKSKATVHKFNKDNKQFEILSFEDYKNSSNEDIRQVLEHLHGKKAW
ncbi:uncharacterized protein LOC129568308 [Sitodiplosis mosellana]|uniref:uncharacterized protein LOC129568308 n=1 Tax=Sitodiplosis mosellana TaxID=263140 RepID=UPI002444424B|nr:uncharacterized protein LOC129568308 [Sitodiplosis mosellana]